MTTLSSSTSWTRTSRRPSSIRRWSSSSSTGCSVPVGPRRIGLRSGRSSSCSMAETIYSAGRRDRASAGVASRVVSARDLAVDVLDRGARLEPRRGRAGRRWAPALEVDPELRRAGAAHSISRSTAAAGGDLLAALEVDHAPVHAVADRAPEVLLDLAARRRLAERARRRSRSPPGRCTPRSGPASANDSSPRVCASQIRSSTVPKVWCGRTLHHSWVDSTTELVATSRSTKSA